MEKVIGMGWREIGVVGERVVIVVVVGFEEDKVREMMVGDIGVGGVVVGEWDRMSEMGDRGIIRGEYEVGVLLVMGDFSKGRVDWGNVF